MRAFSMGPNIRLGFAASSPSATSVGGQGLPPICQNCTTSTTPLWRRDEIGSVLCNACGLFLKLHGRSRPISLKTDVIKSRNRVKGTGPGQGPKKKAFYDPHTLDHSQSQTGTTLSNSFNHRRASQKSVNGQSEDSNSPISRTVTPSMYGHPLLGFNGQIDENQFNNASPSIPPLHIRHSSPGRSASPSNGNHSLDITHTYEQLIAQNSSLKTRVSELEVINDLFRSRVEQLEQNGQTSEEQRRQSEQNLMNRLEETQAREQELKRRLEVLEKEAELREGQPPAKRIRSSNGPGSESTSSLSP